MTILLASFWIWGFLPGPRELVLVALVVVALYGRSETVRRGLPRVLRPWTTRPARAKGDAARGWLADRWFIVVASAAAAAVAAWIVTWMVVVQGPPNR